MMRHTIFHCLCIAMLFLAAGCATNRQLAEAGTPPVLTGGFWQLSDSLLEQFTDEELAREVGYMKELGMDIIIIQYSVRPFWEDRTTQTAYVENSVYAMDPTFEGRQAFDAIFRAAEQHDVKVVLGGVLMPMPFAVEYEQGIRNWISDDAMQYRRELIDRFSAYESFYGWYTPNEPNPAPLAANNADLALMRDATDTVTRFVKTRNPDLVVIKSIGLYMEPDGDGGHKLASREYLDSFWRSWVENLDSVDVWMVIDGVGTGLSSLEHTNMAQDWANALSREFGKDFWVDVENAHMNHVDGVYVAKSFTIEELESSLRVAAEYGSELVTFDYIHYMSRQSPKPEARKLHEDYQAYIKSLGVLN